MTTDNWTELITAIQTLEALQRLAEVNLHTASKYLPDGITKWTQGRPQREVSA